MFIGSINEHVRAALRQLATQWERAALPAYVACSGNFTVERILAAGGFREIHGNDVSLYSCAIGAMLAPGTPIAVSIKDERYAWLAPFIDTPERLVATLMLCTEYFKHADREGAYYTRMADAFRGRWDQLHKGTLEKNAARLKGLRLASFAPMDCVSFLENAPKEAVAIGFPPTYAGGYERMYKKVAEVFAWDRPDYHVFDEERFRQFERALTSFRHWVTMTDIQKPELRSNLVGVYQTTPRAKPVYVYASQGKTSVAMPAQKIQQHPFKLAHGELTGPLNLVVISQGQMNMLRSEFLNPGIAPAAATWHLAVLCSHDLRLVGAASFNVADRPGSWCDLYMMTDLAIEPTPHARLSKLVLAAILSTEAHRYLENQRGRRVRTLGTTAFTDKPVSMKYRGLFELAKRGDGKLNYIAKMARWDLNGALQWWTANHSRTRNSTLPRLDATSETSTVG